MQDTRPKSPFTTTPQPNTPTIPPAESQPSRSAGPGCLAWGLLAIAAGAFSLMVLFIAGILGYLDGQSTVETNKLGTQTAFVQEQLSTWIPRDIEQGHVVLLGARIEGLASLTPPPPELAALIATGTQFALDNQATATATPSATLTPTSTPLAVSPTHTATATVAVNNTPQTDAPLFDVNVLFQEAQTQIANGDYADATLTLDAIRALDPQFRSDEVDALSLESLSIQAAGLLRSGNPATLSAGIVKANEAAQYGDIGNLAGEVYVAGLYLNAQSQELTNPEGAVTIYASLYGQAPNYLDVRNKLYTLRVAVGDAYSTALDFCAAVPQYEAALTLVNNPEVESKLNTARTSCSSGVVAPTVPTIEGLAPVATATPASSAPIGQRN